jgi:hypothetical protein
MTEKKVQRIDGAELRRLAEDHLRENIGTAHPPATVEEPLKSLHELQVHQIELEMQNEELRQERAKREKMEARLGKYSELYDFAPWVTLIWSTEGLSVQSISPAQYSLESRAPC